MMKKMISLLAATAVLATGCTMIPKYTRPEAPVPASWPKGPAYGKTAAPGTPLAPELQWRQFFTDEQLQSVIATALQNNRNLRVAALNVERARALYRIQRAELLPAVNATGSGSRQRIPAVYGTGFSGTGQQHGSDFSLTDEQYSANLGIASWEIDFFGRIRSLEKSALQQFFATEEARRSAQILLVSEVADAYLTLAADRENLRLARSTLEAQQEAYQLIKRRYDIGIAPELDVRQVQTRVDAARVDMARYTQLTAQDQNALNLLVGSPVPENLLPEALNSIAPLPEVSPGTSSRVLLSRPDILQAEDLLKSANADIGAARAAFFPRISLTSAVGTASDDLTGLFAPGTGLWNYGAQIVMPIFDARIWPGLKASKVDKQIAIARYEQAIQSAFRDVADALAMKGTVEDQMEAQKSLVEATAATYRLSNARYTKGIDTYLTVLDAQRSLYAAQQDLINIRLTKLANQVRLYAVLGGGGDSAQRQAGK